MSVRRCDVRSFWRTASTRGVHNLRHAAPQRIGSVRELLAVAVAGTDDCFGRQFDLESRQLNSVRTELEGSGRRD